LQQPAFDFAFAFDLDFSFQTKCENQAARPEGWTDIPSGMAVQGPCLQKKESLLIQLPYYNVLSNMWTANYSKIWTATFRTAKKKAIQFGQPFYKTFDG
jgi:hypothetical protein